MVIAGGSTPPWMRGYALPTRRGKCGGCQPPVFNGGSGGDNPPIQTTNTMLAESYYAQSQGI